MAAQLRGWRETNDDDNNEGVGCATHSTHYRYLRYDTARSREADAKPTTTTTKASTAPRIRPNTDSHAIIVTEISDDPSITSVHTELKAETKPS